MRVLWGHSDEVSFWVGWQIPYVRRRLERDPASLPFGQCQAAGVLNNDGELIAGVVFHNYDPDCPSFEVSFAATSAKWLTRPIICELLRYPFDQIGCRRLTAVTPRKATSARRFLDKFGFRREGVATEGFGDDDAIISRLLKREWLATKWVVDSPSDRREARERQNGKAQSSKAA
jgi:RimJ/RimL family protein N-acetyltransferase